MTVNLSALAGAGQQFFDNNGDPLTGGKLYAYEAGTTTHQATYTTAAGDVAHSNPIILDSAGRVATGEIWVTAETPYKFVLKTSVDATLATWDNIGGISDNASTLSYTPSLTSLLAPGPLTVKSAFDQITDEESGATKVGFLPAGTGAVATTVQTKLRESVSVKDFGAVGDGSTNDTTAIQNAINYVISQPGNGIKTLYFPAGNYSVTTISFEMPTGASGTVSGCTFIFDGMISGQATGNHSAVVEVMAGYSKFINMRVNGNNNDGNICGIHWYTNDLTKNYPGFVQFENCVVTQCFIGLVIGMLPAQAGTYYNQAAVVAKPLAIDAPVSESFVHGMTFEFCLKSVRMEQPNGKINMTDCILGGNDSTFPTYSNATSAVDLRWGELSIIGGALENVWSTTGALASIGRSDLEGSVTFNLNGVVMESVCPIQIIGHSTMRISQNCNWGVNDNAEFFWVFDSADRDLTITDSFLLRGNGSGYPATVIKTVSDVSGTSSINNNFWVNFTNVTFANCQFANGESYYQPFVRNTRAKYQNCWYTIYDVNGVRTTSLKMNPLTNLLSSKVDLAAKTITSYGVNGNATSGGWTFYTPGGSPSWGRYNTGLPTIVGTPVSNAMRMTAAAAGSGVILTATSPKFYVEPGRMYLFTGYVKVDNSSSVLKLEARYYDFGGTASSTPSSYLFNGTDTPFYQGGSFIPVELWFQAPSDATQCELQFYTDNGADIQLFNLSIA